MKAILIVAAFALLGAAAQAQTPSKPASKAAGLGTADRSSNEDRNIRAYIELLRSDVKKDKSQITGEVMQLDTDQSAKFWPVYKEFEAELTALGDKVLGVIKNYADNFDNMTDPVADGIANQILSIEAQRNELKKKYYARFKSALGAIVATRFLQVENQLERIIDLQIASELPIVSQ